MSEATAYTEHVADAKARLVRAFEVYVSRPTSTAQIALEDAAISYRNHCLVHYSLQQKESFK